MSSKVRRIESDEVANIQDLLAEDYLASLVFKELIQNAEDAGAKQLHFGWIADWPSTGHPLLNQPDLIALNDGNFSKKDEKQITYSGASPKATDTDSIGTFGFGMKSVFHFCDAFFIAASKNQDACNGKPLVQVITPLKDIHEIESWEPQQCVEKLILDRLDFWGTKCAQFRNAVPHSAAKMS